MVTWQWVALGLIAAGIVAMLVVWCALAVSGQESEREERERGDWSAKS